MDVESEGPDGVWVFDVEVVDDGLYGAYECGFPVADGADECESEAVGGGEILCHEAYGALLLSGDDWYAVSSEYFGSDGCPDVCGSHVECEWQLKTFRCNLPAEQ